MCPLLGFRRESVNVFFDFRGQWGYHSRTFSAPSPAFQWLGHWFGYNLVNMMTTLDELRQKIDAIDDQLHDLIISRTEIVEQVRAVKSGDRIKIRPAREAEIIYRLLARHKGMFPRRELVRIWRELIIATLRSEGPFSVGVFVDEECEGFWGLARDHFGSFTPMASYNSSRRLIEVVRDQDATVGVLPLPVKSDPNPWWRRLAATGEDVPRVIARLPFAGPGNARINNGEALVICPVGQEPTGRDRAYLVFESSDEMRDTAFNKALDGVGLQTVFTADWSDPTRPEIWMKLVEVEGFVEQTDPRIAASIEALEALGHEIGRVVSLGGYATPLGGEDLGPGPMGAEQ